MRDRRLTLLLHGANLWYLGEGMLGPLFAVFTQKVGGSVLDISWAWATYLIIAGLLHVVVGRLADTPIGKERLMVAGYAMNALFTFGYLLVDAPWKLFAVQAGLGIGSALATSTWYALYSERADGSTEWGLTVGYREIILGGALITGGFIVSAFSFATLFVVMGSIQLIATAYQARILWD